MRGALPLSLRTLLDRYWFSFIKVTFVKKGKMYILTTSISLLYNCNKVQIR